nr:DHH family phosphoesterase [bacterium]
MKTDSLKTLSENQVKQLVKTIGSAKSMVILTHGNPDPDAIASAFALKYLVSALTDCRVRVAYTGVVGRMENRAMIRELKLLMVRSDEINWRDYECLALVDHQPRRGMYPWPENRWPDIIIDHHPRRRLKSPVSFVDVRRNFGSNSGLAASYLISGGIQPPRWLATAIAYGMRTDTQEFSRGTTDIDRQIFLWLFDRIDHGKLFRITHPVQDTRYLTDNWNGLRNARIWQDVAESYAGSILVPDLTAQVADTLMTLRGVCYVLVSGYHNGSLYFSLRIRKKRRDAGYLIRKLIGRKGSAGGHGFMAGAQVPGIESEADAAARARAFHQRLIQLIHPDDWQ